MYLNEQRLIYVYFWFKICSKTMVLVFYFAMHVKWCSTVHITIPWSIKRVKTLSYGK